MMFDSKPVGRTVEILADKDFHAVPVTVAGSDLVKAGALLTMEGATATSTTAEGILLYDVDPAVNPNGALVVQGIIDQKKAEASSGLTYDAAALKTAIPGIVLRDNIGVNA